MVAHHFALALVALASFGCSSHTSPAPEPKPVASQIRGTEEAADSVAERDRSLVYRELLQFYFPGGKQARWIDPRPLGEKRGAPDTASGSMSDDEAPPDATWAESIVEASDIGRVCVLGGDEENCRGRPGGVLRFSPVYAAGKDRVHVFASYTPHGDAVGPKSEMRFTLERRREDWRITDKTTVSTSEK